MPAHSNLFAPPVSYSHGEKGDRHCAAEIPNGVSGFCECVDRRITAKSTCEHATLNCKQKCAELKEGDPGQTYNWHTAKEVAFTADSHGCARWRATGGCSANGPREPEHDSACDVVIESGRSGYCECTRKGEEPGVAAAKKASGKAAAAAKKASGKTAAAAKKATSKAKQSASKAAKATKASTQKAVTKGQEMAEEVVEKTKTAGTSLKTKKEKDRKGATINVPRSVKDMPWFKKR